MKPLQFVASSLLVFTITNPALSRSTGIPIGVHAIERMAVRATVRVFSLDSPTPTNCSLVLAVTDAASLVASEPSGIRFGEQVPVRARHSPLNNDCLPAPVASIAARFAVSDTAAILPEMPARILSIEQMSVVAMGSGPERDDVVALDVPASPGVLSRSHSLKVIGIYASPGTAQVIQHHPEWYRSTPVFIGESVGQVETFRGWRTPIPRGAIPRAIGGAGPDPTSVHTVLVNLGKESSEVFRCHGPILSRRHTSVEVVPGVAA